MVRLGHVALHEGEDFYQFIERLSTQLLATTVETYGGYSRAAARLGLQRTFVYKKLPKSLLASGGTATRAARKANVTHGRGGVEGSEVTRGGTTVRTARFLANRVLALVEHPAQDEPVADEITPSLRSV